MVIKDMLPHGGQILTTRNAIEDFMGECNHALAMNTVYLLATDIDDPERRLRLYSVCARLFYLSRLVYFDGTEIVKLPYEAYEKELFEAHSEDKDELLILLEYWNRLHEDQQVSLSRRIIEEVWDAFVILKALWCRFLACREEQVYIHEYAYAMEYVLCHKGRLSMPKYKNASNFFPINYKDFQPNAHDNDSIAGYFEDIMGCLF